MNRYAIISKFLKGIEQQHYKFNQSFRTDSVESQIAQNLYELNLKIDWMKTEKLEEVDWEGIIAKQVNFYTIKHLLSTNKNSSERKRIHV